MTVVETQHGRLRGADEGGVIVFRGVPFAAPPVGPLRFRPAQPVVPWAGERSAERFGCISHQGNGLEIAMPPPTPAQDEDCLTLNVWTPACDGARRPVLVWVHGGSFTSGAGSALFYRGDHLARRGEVVVVTINYRLGALGWLAHPDLADADSGAAGNWGLSDQVAALRWVHDTIDVFGGDPGNVTVFGESAGAMSVSALLATPAARGLFRRAVAQSGGPMALPAEVATEVAEKVAAEAGVSRVGGLRSAPAEVLVEALAAVQARGVPGGLAGGPVVDGASLPEAPLAAVAAGSAAGVDLLVGTNRDEMKFFAVADQRLLAADLDVVRRRLARAMGPEADRAIEAYTAARTSRGEPVTPFELWSAIETDRVFRAPVTRMADAHVRAGGRAHSYLFTWTTPVLGGLLGSCHVLEIPFVFGTLSLPGVDQLAGGGPEAEALSAAMQDAWAAFARTGDPSSAGVGDWPPYDPSRRATMILGPQIGVEERPREAERAFWDTVAAVGPSTV